MTPLTISIRTDLSLTLYGFSGVTDGQDWVGHGRKLMDRLWAEVRSNRLSNKGLNTWIYEEGNSLFTGVELAAPPPLDSPLEQKAVTLPRYAYYKYVGPFDKVDTVYGAAMQELKKVGMQPRLPYLEIYGHHSDDPQEQETELIWSIK